VARRLVPPPSFPLCSSSGFQVFGPDYFCTGTRKKRACESFSPPDATLGASTTRHHLPPRFEFPTAACSPPRCRLDNLRPMEIYSPYLDRVLHSRLLIFSPASTHSLSLANSFSRSTFSFLVFFSMFVPPAISGAYVLHERSFLFLSSSRSSLRFTSYSPFLPDLSSA